MLAFCILNAYFQYFKCLLTLFLMPTYNSLQNIYWTNPIRDGLPKRPSLTRICVLNDQS